MMRNYKYKKLKKKITFAFDLDEVLVANDAIAKASTDLYNDKIIDKIYSYKDIKSWDLDGIPEVVKLKIIELWKDPQFSVWEKRPIEGTQNFIDFLKIKGYIVYIITSRPTSCYEDTVKYIKKFYDIGRSNILSVGEKEPSFNLSKEKPIRQIKPNFYFDDNIKFCLEAVKYGINTYLITNNYVPWNKDINNSFVTKLKNICFFPNELLK